MATLNVSEQAKELAKEVVFEIKKQQKDKRLHNTKLLMKNYDKLKNHIEKVNSDGFKGYFGEELQDALEENDIFLNSVLRTKARTAQMVSCIDISLEILADEYEENGTYYIYDAFHMYYIEKITFEEIAERLNTGKNTPARWAKEVLNKLNILLCGVEALAI